MRTDSATPKPGRRLRRAALAAALAVCAACSGGQEPEVAASISREAFVEAYVELRRDALSRSDSVPDPAQATAVLERLGVSREDLLEFADVHGGDLEYMARVWSDIESRLDGAAPAPDSTR